MQSNRLFHMCVNLIYMLLYKYFAVKCKVCCQTAAELQFLHCIILALLQPMVKSLNLRAQKRRKPCRSLFSRTGHYHFQLIIILKTIKSCAEERSGWSRIASLFFPVDCEVHRKKGLLRKTMARL